MQVEEMLPQFPIKEFHPFPRGLMGPGAHEIIGPEALKLGFKRTLVHHRHHDYLAGLESAAEEMATELVGR